MEPCCCLLGLVLDSFFKQSILREGFGNGALFTHSIEVAHRVRVFLAPVGADELGEKHVQVTSKRDIGKGERLTHNKGAVSDEALQYLERTVNAAPCALLNRLAV